MSARFICALLFPLLLACSDARISSRPLSKQEVQHSTAKLVSRYNLEPCYTACANKGFSCARVGLTRRGKGTLSMSSSCMKSLYKCETSCHQKNTDIRRSKYAPQQGSAEEIANRRIPIGEDKDDESKPCDWLCNIMGVCVMGCVCACG